MIGTVTLPAIALLAAISGLPGLKGLPMPATKEHARAKAAAVAADTLPPPWRPAWRGGLHSQFVTFGLRPIGRPYGPIKLLPAYDPRKVRVSVDPDSGAYRSRTEVGEVTLGVGYRRRLEDFAREYSMQNLRERWQERSRRDLNNLGANTPIQRTGISVPLSVPRRFLADFVHFARKMPLVGISRRMDLGPVVEARKKASPAPNVNSRSIQETHGRLTSVRLALSPLAKSIGPKNGLHAHWRSIQRTC